LHIPDMVVVLDFSKNGEIYDVILDAVGKLPYLIA